MNFDDFLEQEKQLVESYKSAPSFHGKLSEYISFKRNLGNWAWDVLDEAEGYDNWKGFKQLYEASKREEWLFDFDNLTDYFTREMGHHYRHLWNIALACLGKTELVNRLKKLNSKESEK